MATLSRLCDSRHARHDGQAAGTPIPLFLLGRTASRSACLCPSQHTHLSEGRTRQQTRMLPRSTCSCSCTLRRSSRSCRQAGRVAAWHDDASGGAVCGRRVQIKGPVQQALAGGSRAGADPPRLAPQEQAQSPSASAPEHCAKNPVPIAGPPFHPCLQEAPLEVFCHHLGSLQPQLRLVQLLKQVARSKEQVKGTGQSQREVLRPGGKAGGVA